MNRSHKHMRRVCLIGESCTGLFYFGFILTKPCTAHFHHVSIRLIFTFCKVCVRPVMYPALLGSSSPFLDGRRVENSILLLTHTDTSQRHLPVVQAGQLFPRGLRLTGLWQTRRGDGCHLVYKPTEMRK